MSYHIVHKHVHLLGIPQQSSFPSNGPGVTGKKITNIQQNTSVWKQCIIHLLFVLHGYAPETLLTQPTCCHLDLLSAKCQKGIPSCMCCNSIIHPQTKFTLYNIIPLSTTTPARVRLLLVYDAVILYHFHIICSENSSKELRQIFQQIRI